ncbi:MAG: LEA type 2 family protein, partial [Xanthomonadales bacterium]|nr:LEA type 2 family protein [Xanthomonadales bacterium]
PWSEAVIVALTVFGEISMSVRLPVRRMSWVLLLLGLLSACASGPQLVAPELEAAGIRLQGIGLLQQQFLLTLRVYNPNTVPLPIEGIKYQVELGGRRMAEGESAVAFSIPAHESREFDLRLRTDLLSSWRDLQAWLSGSSEDLEYKLSGSVDVDIPFVRPFYFSQAGLIPLRLEP